jgi:hypothetical protein
MTMQTDWNRFAEEVQRALWNALSPTDGPHEIISGGADGADAMAKRYAHARGWPYREFPADWKKWGKAAGILRNRDIVRHADQVIAFWDGESRGTAHTIETANREGVRKRSRTNDGNPHRSSNSFTLSLRVESSD